MWDAIWLDARIATMETTTPYGAIEDGAIAVDDGRIAWIGPARDLPGAPGSLARRVTRLGGAWVTPGLIDCHTHLVYGGNRAKEFELRLTGASYEEIARAGGGIVSTVAATRAATADELLAGASRRLRSIVAEGVTTVEIKSGYGLDLETETRQLEVARRLEDLLPVDVVTTFLGAHALPPEFEGDPDGYVEAVVAMLEPIAKKGLADAVDAFCERIGFSADQVARVFEKARALSLPVKLHAEQLSNQHGAALVARFGGLSADHLEHLDEAGTAAMAKAGTVAVLLPGAFYFLRETRLPPIDDLRAAGVAMAVATDCNPGTSPVTSPLLMLNMACVLFRLTPEEALAGMTREAARALGRADSHGTLERGKAADFAIWDIEHPAELAYACGANPLREAVRRGQAKTRGELADARIPVGQDRL